MGAIDSFKEHAHNRLCSKMAKDNNFARVLKTTLPPTIARKLVTVTPLRSVPYDKASRSNWHEPSMMKISSSSRAPKNAARRSHQLLSAELQK